jgi:L-asparagine transporter-like permease
MTSSFSIVVALMLERWAPQRAFVSILNAALFGLLLSWLVSLAAHARFRQGRAPGSVIGFVLVVLAIAKTWWDSRLAFLSGLVYLLILNAVYLLIRNSRHTHTAR